MRKPIGVFDSGIGGLTVLKELAEMLPNEDFIYFADSINAPYGPRDKTEILKFSQRIIKFLISKNCKAVVIACNTATAAAVVDVRKEFSIPIIGLEPAVKPACLNTKTGNIGVLATKGTFRGNHFKTTSEKYKDYIEIHLQVAKGLVQLAEKGVFEGEEVNSLIEKYVIPLKEKKVDNIVLGCTHYPLFADTIQKVAGDSINLIDSGEAVARRTKDVLMLNKMLNIENCSQLILFFTTSDKLLTEKVVSKLFNVGEIKPLVELVEI